MKILVTGGTDKAGRGLVQALLRRGESVRVPTPNKDAKLRDGAEAAIGDLLDPTRSARHLAASTNCSRCDRVMRSGD